MIVQNKTKVIKGCGLALFNLLSSKNSLKEIEQIYEFFTINLKKIDMSYFWIYNDKQLNNKIKLNFINQFVSVLPKNKILKNFIYVLYQDNLFSLFYEIIEEFLFLSRIKISYAEGFITSSKKISNNLLKKIENKFKKLFNLKKIIFFTFLDTSMSPGIIVEINNKIYDYSVKGRINSLKNNIFEKNTLS